MRFFGNFIRYVWLFFLFMMTKIFLSHSENSQNITQNNKERIAQLKNLQEFISRQLETVDKQNRSEKQTKNVYESKSRNSANTNEPRFHKKMSKLSKKMSFSNQTSHVLQQQQHLQSLHQIQPKQKLDAVTPSATLGEKSNLKTISQNKVQSSINQNHFISTTSILPGSNLKPNFQSTLLHSNSSRIPHNSGNSIEQFECQRLKSTMNLLNKSNDSNLSRKSQISNHSTPKPEKCQAKFFGNNNNNNTGTAAQQKIINTIPENSNSNISNNQTTATSIFGNNETIGLALGNQFVVPENPFAQNNQTGSGSGSGPFSSTSSNNTGWYDHNDSTRIQNSIQPTTVSQPQNFASIQSNYTQNINQPPKFSAMNSPIEVKSNLESCKIFPSTMTESNSKNSVKSANYNRNSVENSENRSGSIYLANRNSYENQSEGSSQIGNYLKNSSSEHQNLKGKNKKMDSLSKNMLGKFKLDGIFNSRHKTHEKKKMGGQKKV